MTILKILAALLVLGVLITIHEFGHFLLAKLMGVRVNEFAIGMGPRVLKWGKGETVYSLRLLPVGGFCAMEGEDEGVATPQAIGGNGTDQAATDSERSFANKKVWRRVL
ncbi:MAG: site-2 protease family protein, partial [Clostridia bacterium]|nr:site-2 protease family protein [Clostridia bacterium]